MKKILGVVVFFVASAALAAEEPEIAYGKFHRAIASADLAEAMKYAPAARRTEMAAMSEAQKDAQIKMLSLMLPRAFTLMSKTVAPNGKTANLVVTGPGQPVIAGAAPEKMYGRVKMVSEGGEWKVDELAWSNERPAVAAQTQAPAKPVEPKPAAAAKAAARTSATAPQPPTPKLGEAKAPCVYKPVMSNEDMERCR